MMRRQSALSKRSSASCSWFPPPCCPPFQRWAHRISAPGNPAGQSRRCGTPSCLPRASVFWPRSQFSSSPSRLSLCSQTPARRTAQRSSALAGSISAGTFLTAFLPEFISASAAISAPAENSVCPSCIILRPLRWCVCRAFT